MKLRALHIKRYRAIRALELSFVSPLGRVRPVTVLAGPNGSGKTSILFAIVQALRDFAKTPIDEVPPADDQDVHRLGSVPGTTLHAGPAQALVDVQLEFSESERQAIAAHYDSDRYAPVRSSSTTGLDHDFKGRLTLRWSYPSAFQVGVGTAPFAVKLPMQIEPGLALPWLLARQVMLAKSGAAERFAASRAQQDKLGALYIFPQDRWLARHVMGESENDPPPRSDSPIQRGRRDPESVAEILKYQSMYARQRVQPLPESENPELRIRKQLLALCPPIEYLGYLYQDDDPVGAPYFRNGPTGAPYPLSKAASGLQVILDYLVRLNYPRPINDSLILIDEPEVHLHPGWVRRLYLGLPQLGEGNQFILSTHSAELRAMAAEDGALIDLGDLEHGAESKAEKPRSVGAAHAEVDDPLAVED